MRFGIILFLLGGFAVIKRIDKNKNINPSILEKEMESPLR